MSCVADAGVFGQCVDAAMTIPTEVPSMLGVRLNSVSVGWFFTAAVSASGAVYTWGVSDFGCLGHGDDDVHTGEVDGDMEVVNGVNDVDDLEFGVDGEDSDGDSGDVVHFPKEVCALSVHCVVMVATGHGHCLAVTDIGQVFSWGRDLYGQCGHGNETTGDASACSNFCWPVPRRIDALLLSNAIHASAGVAHSLIVGDKGAVFSFGEGAKGRLGHGNADCCRSPFVVCSLCDVRIVSTAAGDDHSLFLAADGTVFACGNNRSGQLGMGYKGISERLPRHIPPRKLSSVRVVAAGDRASCAVTDSGELFMWGLGHYRQRRFGYRESVHSPIRVSALCGEIVVAVSTNVSNTIVVTRDGSVFVWGWADAVQCENATVVSHGSVACRRYASISCTLNM